MKRRWKKVKGRGESYIQKENERERERRNLPAKKIRTTDRVREPDDVDELSSRRSTRTCQLAILYAICSSRLRRSSPRSLLGPGLMYHIHIRLYKKKKNYFLFFILSVHQTCLLKAQIKNELLCSRISRTDFADYKKINSKQSSWK